MRLEIVHLHHFSTHLSVPRLRIQLCLATTLWPRLATSSFSDTACSHSSILCSISLTSTDQQSPDHSSLSETYSSIPHSMFSILIPHSHSSIPSPHSNIFCSSIRTHYFILILFLYSHSTVPIPLARFPKDQVTWDVDQQFMWGSAVLVTPVLVEGATSVEGYFPPGARWFNLRKVGYFSSAVPSFFNPSLPFHLYPQLLKGATKFVLYIGLV